MSADECGESRKVWEFFGRVAHGTFVDVGANHPVEQNLTWFLEQQGWGGVLVEPNPVLAKLLCEQRPRCQTFQCAAGNPQQVGEVKLHLGLADSHSALNPASDSVMSGQSVRVQLRTLDSILAESGVTRIDFLSLDVEEMELDALDGFDLEKWQPRLILIEDFFYHRRKLRYLRNRGYRLVRRTGYNNWYVPQNSPHTLFSTSSPREIFNLARKRWVSGPIIAARQRWRQRRRHKQERQS